VDLSSFKEGDMIRVSAVSKGKGFQGVVKRHGFHGGPRSHGQKHSEREPGSISGGLRTGLRHGMRMAGRMGSDRVTVKNLKIAQINSEAGLILVLGEGEHWWRYGDNPTSL
jgi:large subunit ribosomal protein L3